MKMILSSKRRHYVAGVSTFLIVVALIVGMVGCGGDGGAPSQNLEIYDWYDLDAVRNNLAGNHTLMNDLDSTTPGYEELASSIANGGKGWEPIGILNVWFSGTFSGQGYRISDFFVNRPDEILVGLFGKTGGIIKDIGVVNVIVTGKEVVGGLVGDNIGTVSNSYATGSVSGNDYSVGGLAGGNWGTVSNSYSSADVSGWGPVGGLVGHNVRSVVGPSDRGTVSNSYATGSVSSTSYEVGGLVGRNDGIIVSSYSTGDVSSSSPLSFGGLVGVDYQEYWHCTDSFWDTQTSGQADSAGGTGKNTTEMKDIVTFTDTQTEGLNEPWDIIAVDNVGTRNLSYTWNIVNNVTYPFLSWQFVS